MLSKFGECRLLFDYFYNTAVTYLILLMLPCFAHASDLFTDEPQLRIELGMHVSQIDSIGVNRDCSLMVTGSADKTARLWDLPQTTDKGTAAPRLLRIFRPPINPDNFDGRIYAVAIDPEGKLVAVAGYTPSSIKDRWVIYIFDAISAHVIATINDIPYRVMHLAFSKDGDYLAATMKSGYGVRVWKTGNWEQSLAEDSKDYGDTYGATFDNKGRLYTTTYITTGTEKYGYIRRYAAKTFKLENEKKILGELPIQVAAQSKGSLIAVGFAGKAKVELYESLEEGLKLVNDAVKTELKEHIGKISWSSDDKYLFAAGAYQEGNRFLFWMWGEDGKGAPKKFEGPRRIISQLLPCGNNIAFGSREPAFGVIDVNGKPKIWQSRVGVNMNEEKQFGGLKVSDNGLRISFDLGTEGEKQVVFDVSELSLRDVSQEVEGLFTADYTSLPITKWNQNETIRDGKKPNNPLFNGKPISPMLTPLPGGEVKEQGHRYSNDEEWTALAISYDKKSFVLGTEWRLRGYEVDKLERPLWVNRNVPGKVWAVNISRNGKLLVAAYDDGTFRWHRMSDGKELLALLVHPEEYRRWIAWTPQGYFTASIGGEDLIGWHINNGPDKAALFYPAHHFREKYYRPNIVRRVLITLDEGVAIREEQDRLDKITQLEHQLSLDKLPPVLKIVAPQHNYKFDDPEQIIWVEVSAPSNLRPTKIEVLVDGIYSEPSRPIEPREIDRRIPIQVFLPQKDSRVTLLVYSDHEKGLGESIDFKWVGPPATVTAKPKLFGLAIGIKDYKKNILKYADKDAKDFAAALKTQEGKLFSNVDIEVLNENVRKDDIIIAFKNLATKLRTEPPNTVTAIFYSGHGVSKQRRFYFLPVESPEPEKDGINQEDFYYYLNDIRGRKLVFVDACWSNTLLSGVQTDVAGLLNYIKSRGRISTFLYAATDSGQASTAFECKDLKNGCFTKALVEAISEGLADQYAPLEFTDTYELHTYLTRRVSQLSNKAQRPNMVMTDEGLKHFNIATHSKPTH